MANYCGNTIKAKRKILEELIVPGDEGEDVITFNKLVPFPGILGCIISPSLEWGTVQGKDNIPLTDNEKAFLVAEYGTADWYQWCCDHWGTKWDAFNSYIPTDFYESGPEDITYIECDTAWSPPTPVIGILSEKYPKDEIVIDFIDEGGGFNCESTFLGGIEACVDVPFPNREEEE